MESTTHTHDGTIGEDVFVFRLVNHANGVKLPGFVGSAFIAYPEDGSTSLGDYASKAMYRLEENGTTVEDGEYVVLRREEPGRFDTYWQGREIIVRNTLHVEPVTGE